VAFSFGGIGGWSLRALSVAITFFSYSSYVSFRDCLVCHMFLAPCTGLVSG
jgi:hypothetical protein